MLDFAPRSFVYFSTVRPKRPKGQLSPGAEDASLVFQQSDQPGEKIHDTAQPTQALKMFEVQPPGSLWAEPSFLLFFNSTVVWNRISTLPRVELLMTRPSFGGALMQDLSWDGFGVFRLEGWEVKSSMAFLVRWVVV